jgi:hypothetical protein
VNQVIGKNEVCPDTRTSKIDYAALYEKIGDIVIERAHAGDKECLSIYERAYRLQTAYDLLAKERNTSSLGGTKKASDDGRHWGRLL